MTRAAFRAAIALLLAPLPALSQSCPEPQLEAVQDHVRDGAGLAILQRQTLDRFKGCLPAP